jgi:hypothetical protein
MQMFKRHSFLAAATAAAALLISANAYAANRDRSQAAGLIVENSQPVEQARNTLVAFGYGRGWCYWHPYGCYREDDSSDDSDE